MIRWYVCFSLIVTILGGMSKASATSKLPHILKLEGEELAGRWSIGTASRTEQAALEFLKIKQRILESPNWFHQTDIVSELGKFSRYHLNVEFYVDELQELFNSNKVGPEGRTAIMGWVAENFNFLHYGAEGDSKVKLWNFFLSPLQPEFLEKTLDGYFVAESVLDGFSVYGLATYVSVDRNLPFILERFSIERMARSKLEMGRLTKYQFGLLVKKAFETLVSLRENLQLYPNYQRNILSKLAEFVVADLGHEPKREIHRSFVKLKLDWRDRLIVDKVFSGNPSILGELCQATLEF
jgi:hypothetical protein